MNPKEMIVSIITAMVVMTMFASSAMAITVDGQVSPANEWDTYDEKTVDTDGIYPICSAGYNVTTLWMRVEGDTLFVRMDVAGVPGDADTDGNDTTNTNTNPGNCGCAIADEDEWPGVGIGATDATVEEYIAKIDGNNNGTYDYELKYQLGSSALYSSGTEITGATTAAAHTGVTGGIVELSVKIDQYCDINPANYCVKGEADTDCNGNEEDVPKKCHFDEPPTAHCYFDPISCGYGTLIGTGSSDDGTIIEYAWDFYDDGTYDESGATLTTVSYNIIGTHDVRLMVTDDVGQTDNCTIPVTLTGDPVADAKADGSDGPVQLPASGKIVTFCDESPQHPYYPSAWIVSREWTILSQTYTTECVDVFVNETTTASLTVKDNRDCTHTDYVTLNKPPTQKVPILTLPGLLALIGMMCIVGAGRILTRGRRS